MRHIAQHRPRNKAPCNCRDTTPPRALPPPLPPAPRDLACFDYASEASSLSSSSADGGSPFSVMTVKSAGGGVGEATVW